MSLRGRSAAVAIFKPKVWHPVAKHGSGKQDGSPITKNMRFAASFRFLFLSGFCFVPSNHISFRDDKLFRQRLPRRAQNLRPPRNDKSGRFCGKMGQFPERKGFNNCRTSLRSLGLRRPGGRIHFRSFLRRVICLVIRRGGGLRLGRGFAQARTAVGVKK